MLEVSIRLTGETLQDLLRIGFCHSVFQVCRDVSFMARTGIQYVYFEVENESLLHA